MLRATARLSRTEGRPGTEAGKHEFGSSSKSRDIPTRASRKGTSAACLVLILSLGLAITLAVKDSPPARPLSDRPSMGALQVTAEPLRIETGLIRGSPTILVQAPRSLPAVPAPKTPAKISQTSQRATVGSTA